MKISAEVTPGDVADKIAARRAAAAGIVADVVVDAAQLGKRAALLRAPVGPSGNFIASLDVAVPSGEALAASVVSNRPPGYHAHLVEKGRGPGKMPPARKIAAVLKISLTEAFPIARAIGRGTRGHDVFDHAADDARPAVQARAEKALEQIGRLE